MNKLDVLVKSVLCFLLTNISFLMIYNSWQDDEHFIGGLFNSTPSVFTYFFLLFFCFLWTIKDNIIHLSLSLKDGIRADLKQIQKEKKEINSIKKEIRDLALHMLESHIIIIENSKRWSGWVPKRFEEIISKIEADCERLNVSDIEREKIFKTKQFWDEIDSILPVFDKMKQSINDRKQSEAMEKEWDEMIKQERPLSANFLNKFVPYTSFDDLAKEELLNFSKKK